MSLLLDGGEASSVRHRKGGVTGIVQELDVFMKVVDEVKEEPRASNGIVSILCLSLIFFLVVGQLYEYFTDTDVEYKFSVDVDYEQSLTLDLDMIIATPCSNLAVMPMGVDAADSNPLEDLFGALIGEEKPKKKTFINKNPTRFNMSPEEEKLWATLQKIHKEHFKPGTPLKPVNERTFMHSDVEAGLREAADTKQRLQVDELERLRKQKKKGREADNALALPGGHSHDDEGMMLLISNGMGVFHIIAAGGESDDSSEDVDKGTACRVSGKVPVIKGKGDRLTITVGKSTNIGNIVAHFGNNRPNAGNISHRIERFHFGPHVWGLVTPLAGIEQLIDKPNVIFQYYIKVVPTKIYKRGALFSRPDITYQYAVSYSQKHGKEQEHSHDSVIFDYEFADVVVEVWPVSMSVTQLFLRLCSIIGGVFATSRFLVTLASVYDEWRYPI